MAGMFGYKPDTTLSDLYLTPPKLSRNEAHWRSKSQGSASAKKTTLGDLLHGALAGGAKKAGLGDKYANHLAGRATTALNDLTPVGAATAASQAGADWRSGNTLGALMNGAIAALSGLPGGVEHAIVPPIMARMGRRYPMAPRDLWYADADFTQRGGQIVEMSPDEFLAQTGKPLQMDEITLDNIADLKAHIEAGRQLDPLMIGSTKAGHDGRHRAYAAKELGIEKVPVIIFGR